MKRSDIRRALVAFLSQRALHLFVAALVIVVCPASAQLSQNSGINANDTYAIFDITFQGQGTQTVSKALYNPQTNTTGTSLTLTPNVRHFHVEIGYDTNDQLVMNLFSTDSTSDPTTYPTSDVSQIQLRNGKLTIFDETGTPYPISLPNNAPLPFSLSLLGAIPGSSVLNYLIIQDPGSTATAENATVQYSGYTTTSSNKIQGQMIASGTRVQMAYISASLGSDASGTQTFAYQQFSGGWALTQSTVNSSFPNVQHTAISQFSNLQWYDNSVGDQRRAAKASAPPPPPTFSTANVNQFPLPGATNNTPSLDVINWGTGPTNVLYQHGIFSNETTWDRMNCPASGPCNNPWLRADFGWNTIAKSNLKSTDYLENQATSLINLLQGTGKNQFLSIGHSQGGLIIRDVGYQRGDLVNRLITLGTPNNGAEMAEFDRATLAGALTDLAKIMVSWARGTPLSDSVFTLGNYMIVSVPTILVAAADSSIPALNELAPNSAYLNNLNSRSELFTNAGIKSDSRWRFVEYRLIGDAKCNPEDPCGGRAVYNYANAVYYGLRTCQIIAGIFGDWTVFWRCGIGAFVLDYIDLFWYVYTSFGDTSDGIVNGGGQYYTHALYKRSIGRADSHLGTTRSDKVKATLDTSLQFDFGLVARWCQTGSVSPSSLSVSDVGGSQSFSLYTGSPCPWTAVSSAPWITINSGASGTASATVSYFVDFNPSPLSRTGTITITGLGSNVAVTVTQAGLPAAAAIGSVTITGNERSVSDTYCVSWLGCYCRSWRTITTYDTGTVSVTVNGHTDSVSYGQGSTPNSLAIAVANAINNDSASYVQAGAIGSMVWLVSKATKGANYPFSSSSTTTNTANFSGSSFATADSGATLTGSP